MTVVVVVVVAAVVVIIIIVTNDRNTNRYDILFIINRRRRRRCDDDDEEEADGTDGTIAFIIVVIIEAGGNGMLCFDLNCRCSTAGGPSLVVANDVIQYRIKFVTVRAFCFLATVETKSTHFCTYVVFVHMRYVAKRKKITYSQALYFSHYSLCAFLFKNVLSKLS